MKAARVAAGADRAALRALIEPGLKHLGIELPAGGAERLARYVELLARWNAVHNLTAVRDPAEMVPRHLLDSLVAAPLLAAPSVLDVGTGAGLPGIPLAIARPDLSFTLLDVAAKRVQFVQHAVAQLGLGNATVQRAAVETVTLPTAPACVVARAFAPLERLLGQLARLAPAGTRVLVWKAAVTPEERARVVHPWRIAAVHPVSVPGLDAARCIVALQQEPV